MRYFEKVMRLIVVVFLFASCSGSANKVGNNILVSDIASYTDFETINKRYKLFDIKKSGSKKDFIVISATTVDPVIGDFDGYIDFIFLNNRLVMIGFYPQDMELFVSRYFPGFKELPIGKRKKFAHTEMWKAKNEIKNALYFGVADSDLYEEFVFGGSE